MEKIKKGFSVIFHNNNFMQQLKKYAVVVLLMSAIFLFLYLLFPVYFSGGTIYCAPTILIIAGLLIGLFKIFKSRQRYRPLYVLSFVLIHLGIIFLILSVFYGSVSAIKYDEEIKINPREEIRLNNLPYSVKLTHYDIKYRKGGNFEPQYSAYLSLYENARLVKEGAAKFNSPFKYYGYNFYLLGWESDKNRCTLLVRYVPEYPFVLFSYFIIGLGILTGLILRINGDLSKTIQA